MKEQKILSEKEQREVTSKNLKKLLKEKNVSAAEVGRTLKVSESTARSWFNGSRYPRLSQLQALADYFGVTKSYIETDHESQINTINIDNVIPSSEITEIPIIGEIACGAPIFSEQNIVGYLPVIAADVKGGEYFALIAKGDSMNPTIQNGDKVTIRRQPTAENGDIVAACIDGEITLKRFKKIGEQVMLLPDNRDYDPIIIEKGSQSYIVGKAVSSTKTF